MHENIRSWGWPYKVPSHRSCCNYHKPNANANVNNRWDSTPHPTSKPTTSRTNAHLAKEKNTEATISRKGRVVSIPIYDAGTESPSVATMEQGVAAMKVQCAFRGFCVRKSKPLEKLWIIGQVMSEADEIGRLLPTQTQLIRGNEEDFLKLDHQIMFLFLRLDAIQGVKSFVQEARRAVNCRVLQLLDAIIAGKDMSREGAGESDHGHIPEMDSQPYPKNRTPELPETQLEKEEVMKKSENEGKCEELNNLNLSSSEIVLENEEYHIGADRIHYYDGYGILKERAIEGVENEALEKLLADLCKKVELSDKLINDLSLRGAQLERQIFEENDNETEK